MGRSSASAGRHFNCDCATSARALKLRRCSAHALRRRSCAAALAPAVSRGTARLRAAPRRTALHCAAPRCTPRRTWTMTAEGAAGYYYSLLRASRRLSTLGFAAQLGFIPAPYDVAAPGACCYAPAPPRKGARTQRRRTCVVAVTTRSSATRRERVRAATRDGCRRREAVSAPWAFRVAVPPRHGMLTAPPLPLSLIVQT